MAKARVVDKYPNIINVTLTESAAGTLTFTDLNIGFSAFDRIGLLIHRLEYYPENNLLDSLVADTDFVHFGVAASNQLADINADERAVIDVVRLKAILEGAAATLFFTTLPIVRDYTAMPGGGILVAPRPLYGAVVAGGMAAAINVQLRMYFTTVDMADADYFELLESRQFYGA